MRLNKTTVEALEPPAKGERLVWDDGLRGFGVRVTAKGVRSYIAQARVNGKARRVTIGRHGVLTADEARKRARRRLASMGDGTDPIEEKRAAAAKQERERALGVTLRQAWDDYRVSRRSDGKTRKASTLRDMESHLERNFADWLDAPVAEITREGVLQRHRDIAKRGAAQADQAMRYLRSLLNFARDSYTAPDGTSVLPANPVDVLRAARQWHAPKRRRTLIPRNKIGEVIVALETIATDPGALRTTQTAADLVLLVLFTGLRIGEAAPLRWDDVDTESWTITLADPKNRQPTTLPLSAAAVEVMERRPSREGYVFAGRSSGYLEDTRNVRERVCEQTGVVFTNHDLRRTFVTVAESLEVGEYTLKRLLNHAVSGDDVTGGYVTPDLERLRQAAGRVGDSMRERAAVARAENVRTLRPEGVGRDASA